MNQRQVQSSRLGTIRIAASCAPSLVLAPPSGLLFYLRATPRGTPEMALLDIGRAERLHREATTAAGTDLTVPPRSAGGAVAEARLASTAAPSGGAGRRSAVAGVRREGLRAARRVVRGAHLLFEGDVKVKRSREFV